MYCVFYQFLIDLAKMKKVLFWPAILVSVIVFIVAVSKLPEGAQAPRGDTPSVSVGSPSEVSDADNKKGAENPRVVVIEYSDFQCPFCAQYAPHLEQLTKDFPNEVVVIYRHFPLSTIHPNSQKAAFASEAAANQGKFWEMHDILFERQEEWSDALAPEPFFEGFAREIGLDLEQYRVDFESDEVSSRVREDAAEATSIGLNSTPSLFINGDAGAFGADYDSLKNAVNSALSQTE